MKLPWLTLMTILICSYAGKAQPFNNPDDSLKKTNLYSIIRSRETERLKDMLNNGLSANDSVEHYSLLMLAAMSGTMEEMKLLVEHGATVNYINHDSLTALWLAIPDSEKTLFLINHGADIHAVGIGGKTMIMKLALTPGSASLIKLFIQKGLDLQNNNPGNILIKNALLSADTNNLSIFINAGLDVNACDKKGEAPIEYASLYSCYPTIKMLVEHGALIDVVHPKYKFTPLMNAACAGDEETTEFLIVRGANMRPLDFKDYNALMWLATSEMDRPDLVDSLCRGLGDQLFKKGQDGTDALSWWKSKGNNKSADVILKYKSGNQ